MTSGHAAIILFQDNKSTSLFMQSTVETEQQEAKAAGKRYFVNIEGQEYPWPESSITTPEIRKLGNLPADQPVVCEDPEGNEKTLREDEVIELKPGHRLGRAPKYKRG